MLCTASSLIAGKKSPILLISGNIPSRSLEPQMDGPPPPPPPPLPLPSTKRTQAARSLSSTISPFIQKLQQTLHQSWIEPEQRQETVDVLAPQLGPYFCYGTLMDPSLLSDILGLADKPRLRPAKLVGYSLMLWGQYPALVDDSTEAVVEGMVYDVEYKKHAQRLTEYETQAYRPSPCLIRFTDGEEPAEVTGTTFKYVGNPADLNEGYFDLGLWLKRMGRGGVDGGELVSTYEA